MALGWSPFQDHIVLSLGSDYTLQLNAPENETIPDDTTITIKIYPPGQKDTLTSIASWDGTVASDNVSWRILAAQADLVPDGAHFRIYVYYPEAPTLPQCWYRGGVVREQ